LNKVARASGLRTVWRSSGVPDRAGQTFRKPEARATGRKHAWRRAVDLRRSACSRPAPCSPPAIFHADRLSPRPAWSRLSGRVLRALFGEPPGDRLAAGGGRLVVAGDSGGAVPGGAGG